MTSRRENPQGGHAKGVFKSCSCGGRCKSNNSTPPHEENQSLKLHHFGRRALDNLKYELLQRGDLDGTGQSAIRAVEFLLKNF